jgi:predicted TPR repeat methyltransferase
MKSALQSGGMLAFTLERAAVEPRVGYVLESHGRYAHTESYVRRELAALGLTVQVIDVDLRMESGRPVGGLLVWARSVSISSS